VCAPFALVAARVRVIAAARAADRACARVAPLRAEIAEIAEI
jgi:hypothetical protein